MVILKNTKLCKLLYECFVFSMHELELFDQETPQECPG